MIIDLHVHEKTFSPCSKMSLEEIVSAAKRRGLDAVCITDHDSMGIKKQVEEYSKQSDFPIFVGIEVYTFEGDIVAYGLNEAPKQRIHAQELIDLVNEEGGFCFSAHPFRNNMRGLEENLRMVRGLFGVEVLNGNTDNLANKKAEDYCKELCFLPVACSDAHNVEQVGKYATYFPDKVGTLGDLIVQLRSGRCRPMRFEDGNYVIHFRN